MSGLIDPDLLFPADERSRAVARDLYAGVKDLPIISPHGHTDPRWFAENEPFPDPAQLLIVARPLHLPHALQPGRAARGPRRAARWTAAPVETDARKIWRRFAENYHLFRGTPTRLWLDHALRDVFGIDEPLTPTTADAHLRPHRRLPRRSRSSARARCSSASTSR